MAVVEGLREGVVPGWSRPWRAGFGLDDGEIAEFTKFSAREILQVTRNRQQPLSDSHLPDLARSLLWDREP